MNIRDDDGSSALNYATPNYKLVEFLLQEGADVNISDTFGETAMRSAAACGRSKSLDILIKAGGDVNSAGKFHNKTALMDAAYGGYKKCVNLLISAGAKMNAIDKEGCTALIGAAKYGHSQCVHLLIQAGAGVNTTDKKGCTALSYAVDGYTGSVKRLECYKSAECVKLLVSAGANVNGNGDVLSTVILKKNCSPKGCKCKDSSADTYSLVRLFLNAGVDLNTIGKYSGMTTLKPLIVKAHHLPQEVLMLILAAGARTEDLSNIDARLWNKTLSPKFPEFIKQFMSKKSSLMSMCRVVVRKHLLDLDPHINLFYTVQLLRLPSLLIDYLLYNTFLGDN